MAIASNGQWITLTHAGIKREGELYAYFCETVDQARSDYEKAFRDYYFNQHGRLVLRRNTPQIMEGEKGWVVYSRLAIIDEINGTEAVSLVPEIIDDYSILASTMVIIRTSGNLR